MIGFESDCVHRTFDCPEVPTSEQHRHCADCNAPLMAVGGGGDDGSHVGGYDDVKGNGTRKCEGGCDSLLCQACYDKYGMCKRCIAIENAADAERSEQLFVPTTTCLGGGA